MKIKINEKEFEYKKLDELPISRHKKFINLLGEGKFICTNETVQDSSIVMMPELLDSLLTFVMFVLDVTNPSEIENITTLEMLEVKKNFLDESVIFQYVTEIYQKVAQLQAETLAQIEAAAIQSLNT